MQKIIRKKLYDTETSLVLAKFTLSYWGDPSGYEERLCQTPDGSFFLYNVGGAASPYRQAEILPLTKPAAQKWLDALKNRG